MVKFALLVSSYTAFMRMGIVDYPVMPAATKQWTGASEQGWCKMIRDLL